MSEHRMAETPAREERTAKGTEAAASSRAGAEPVFRMADVENVNLAALRLRGPSGARDDLFDLGVRIKRTLASTPSGESAEDEWTSVERHMERLKEAKDAVFMVERLLDIAPNTSSEERGRVAFYREILTDFFDDVIARRKSRLRRAEERAP